MTDTHTRDAGTDVLPEAEVAGLSAKTVAHVIHYRRKTYVTKPAEGYALLKRVRTLLRDGTTDLVPLVHRDGFVWLAVGPSIPIAIDEIETDQGHSEKHTLKRLGLD
jgi:DNA-binding response OmpR family regulator